MKKTKPAEHEPFLKQILAQPDDVAPRQVYADWLQEREDPRGEFIRLQCEAANAKPRSFEREELLWQAELLRKEHGKKWDQPVRKFAGRIEYFRGFVEHVSTKIGKFVQGAEQFMHMAPIQSLKLNSDKDKVAELAKTPQLEQLLKLNLTNVGIAAKRAPDLFASPHLANLVHLDLSGNNIGRKGVQNLVNDARLDRLEVLSLDNNKLTDAGLKTLCEWPHLAQIRDLRLGSNGLTAAGLSQLADCPHLAKLESLHLAGDDLNAGMAGLARAKLPALRRLTLHYVELDDAGVAALLEAPFLEQLERLNLWGNHIQLEGVQALASCRRLTNLKSLDLGHNPVTDDAAPILMQCPWFDQLEECSILTRANAIGELLDTTLVDRTGILDLAHARMNLPDLEVVLASPKLAQVTRLILNSNLLGDDGARQLAACSSGSNLRQLDLAGTRMTNDGLQAIIDSPHFANLRSLTISGNGLTDAIYGTLLESSLGQQLSRLTIDSNIPHETGENWERCQERWKPRLDFHPDPDWRDSLDR